MAEATDFETLVLLCRRASALPPLPLTVMKLIREIDEGDASTNQLERIVTSDPALTVAFMRWAALEDPDCILDAGACIRTTILLLGQRAVRNMAVSVLVQSALRTPSSDSDFDAHLFARHSVFVGILAHYLAARSDAKENRQSDISDVFAAGVLHELPCYLLARLAPSGFNRVVRYARKREVGLDRSFEMLYGKHIGELGAASCETWHLPDVFIRYMRCMPEPWMGEELERGICAIRYAELLARQSGWGVEDWPVHEELPIDVLEEVELPESEQEMVLNRIGAMVDIYCPNERTVPVQEALPPGVPKNRLM